MVRLAVFDYDGTAISGQSGSLFSWYLFRNGYISVPTGLRLGWWGLRYVLHLPKRQEEAREVVFSAFAGRTPEEVRRVMRRFHDEVLDSRYRPAAMAEVQRCKEEGCLTMLVSATFSDIAQAAGDKLDVDVVLSTRMELGPDGRYTGSVAGPVVAGHGKTVAVVRWANEHIGPAKWMIEYAYGDHFTDEDLLAASEKPYAVSPSKSLERVAKRRKWEILDWK